MPTLTIPTQMSCSTGGTSVEGYARHFDDSARMFARARQVIAGGSTHDGWMIEPFPVYVAEARGARKWDLAGGELIDYWMGHGALIAGHSFPPVVKAICDQAARGTHFGGPSELEVRWAELVSRLVPSAEKVRFTSSGTEATMLALRVARAYTGRDQIIKVDGHFHGWHDEALAHYFPANAAGFNEGTVSNVAIANATDIESLLELLAEGRAAAVILEPGGGGSGGLAWSKEYLSQIREATISHNTLLIFDEVVSGFRYSPGGVQEICGVLPDLTVLAKILSGGLPGGAVAGKTDIMSVFGTGKVIDGRSVRVPHLGTFNANPLSASAGIALLSHISDGIAQARAEAAARKLVEQVNQIADYRRVDVYLYQQSSIFHILIGARRAGLPVEPSDAVITLYAKHPEKYVKLRRSLLLEGLDTHPVHGWMSTAHTDADVQSSADAFNRAFDHISDQPEFAY